VDILSWNPGARLRGRVTQSFLSQHSDKSGVHAGSGSVAEYAFVGLHCILPHGSSKISKHRGGIVEAVLLRIVLNALHTAGPLGAIAAGTRPDAY
jgi:hypothetical protein